MYVIGLVVAVFVAFILHIVDKKEANGMLIIELPEYKAPSARTIWIYVWEKVKDGTYSMFSIEGKAERVEVNNE